MSWINWDEVVGYRLGGRIFCRICIKYYDGYLLHWDIKDLILSEDVEMSNQLYYCDECGFEIG